MPHRATSALVIALLVGLGACSSSSSSDDDDAVATTTTEGPAGTTAIQFRPVVAPQASTYPCTAEPAEGDEILPDRSQADEEPVVCMEVGPVGFDGTSLSRVEATQGGAGGDQWVVSVEVAEAERDRANEVINACFLSEETCPTMQLAIVVDEEVISAPTVQSKDLADDEFQISGGGAGGFSESDAEDLVDRITGR